MILAVAFVAAPAPAPVTVLVQPDLLVPVPGYVGILGIDARKTAVPDFELTSPWEELV